ncbi:MAG: lysophospholipid acyltransferase family protein [Bacteroidota bacterium]
MNIILYWIPTLLFYLSFAITLGFFHLLQLIALKISYQSHKKVVDGMIWAINTCLLIVGARRKINNLVGDLPTDRPMIIVSNHQSMFDIPAIGGVLQKHHPKYIAKASLAKGIPGVSINIRRGGSAVINRKNKEGAMKAIDAFCQYLNENNYAGCIFPEGTRSKDGSMKAFRVGGLTHMIEQMPEATIVPVVLGNFWKIGRYNMAPIPFGIPLRCTILPPIKRADKSTLDIVTELEEQIKQQLLVVQK